MQAPQLWQAVLGDLKNSRLSANVFRNFLSTTTLVALEDDVATIAASNTFTANTLQQRHAKEVEKALEPWVYEWVQKRQGSISAEHGLGLAKKAFIGYSRSETMIKLMKGLKNFFDPVSNFALSMPDIIGSPTLTFQFHRTAS